MRDPFKQITPFLISTILKPIFNDVVSIKFSPLYKEILSSYKLGFSADQAYTGRMDFFIKNWLSATFFSSKSIVSLLNDKV